MLLAFFIASALYNMKELTEMAEVPTVFQLEDGSTIASKKGYLHVSSFTIANDNAHIATLNKRSMSLNANPNNRTPYEGS